MEIVEKIREKALKRKKKLIIHNKFIKHEKKSIILYNLNNTIFGVYSSIIQAADDINCNPKTIRRALKPKKKY